MTFTPKTQADIDAENLCPEGDYPFTIKEAQEKTDKKNRPFFALKLFVHAIDGRDYHIYDNVSPAWMAHKLLHLCECTGLYPQYAQGRLSFNDLIGKQGYCTVSRQDSQDGYGPKSIIYDYIVKDRKQSMKDNAQAGFSDGSRIPDDDDIPT